MTEQQNDDDKPIQDWEYQEASQLPGMRIRRSPVDLNAQERKIDLIMRLYIDPGDQDYIAARWGFQKGLYHIFYWCSAQAVEKYMKAIILLQDESADGYGHNLRSLFASVRRLDQNSIIPRKLNIPKTTAKGRRHWHNKGLELYIHYLSVYGAPDNRYAYHGTYVNGPVLHALDFVCVHFRRMIRTTNFLNADLCRHFCNVSRWGGDPDTSPDWFVDPDLMLERVYNGNIQIGEQEDLLNSFRNMNLSFFGERPADESSFGGLVFHGSPLYNHLVRLSQIDDSEQNVAEVQALREWAVERIPMSDSVRKYMKFPTKEKKANKLVGILRAIRKRVPALRFHSLFAAARPKQ